MFDIDKQYYAITITPVSKDKVFYKDDIEEKILDLAQHGVQVVSKGYEMKKDKTLHCHLACIGPKGLRYVDCMARGWHIYINKIYNGNRWLSYIQKISKDARTEADLLLAHLANHQLLFCDD